jgi:alpha-beta hydrolase superfamily lysophospholipase
MQSVDSEFRAADGAGLYVRSWSVGEPRAIVQVLHGMAEHGARYGRLAEALGRSGYSTYAHDHRGHGRSNPEGSPPGHIADDASWTRLVADAHAVNMEIASRHPGVPIIVLGHSMGSFVLQQMLFEHPGDMVAAALSGSNGRPPAIASVGKLVVRIERARVGRRNPSPLVQGLTFGGYNKAFKPARTDFDWLSRDPAEVDSYVADPLCGFDVSTQTWLDLLNALTWIAKPANVARVPRDLPLYLFAGDRDPVGDNGKGMRRLHDAYQRAGVHDLRLKLYPGGRHEMLNETNRDQVTADLIEWCDQVVAARD